MKGCGTTGLVSGNGQLMPKYSNPSDPVQHSRRMAQPVMFPGPPIDIGAQFQPHQRAASLLGAVRGLVGIECGVVSD